MDSGFGSRTATLMFDEGAEVCLVRTINANFKPSSLQINGVGQSAVSCRHTVDIAVHPICLKQLSTPTHQSSSYSSPISVHCYVVDKPFHVNTILDSAAICQLMADKALKPLADSAVGRPTYFCVELHRPRVLLWESFTKVCQNLVRIDSKVLCTPKPSE